MQLYKLIILQLVLEIRVRISQIKELLCNNKTAFISNTGYSNTILGFAKLDIATLSQVFNNTNLDISDKPSLQSCYFSLKFMLNMAPDGSIFFFKIT